MRGNGRGWAEARAEEETRVWFGGALVEGVDADVGVGVEDVDGDGEGGDRGGGRRTRETVGRGPGRVRPPVDRGGRGRVAGVVDVEAAFERASTGWVRRCLGRGVHRGGGVMGEGGGLCGSGGCMEGEAGEGMVWYGMDVGMERDWKRGGEGEGEKGPRNGLADAARREGAFKYTGAGAGALGFRPAGRAGSSDCSLRAGVQRSRSIGGRSGLKCGRGGGV
ncbi:hypothetical protein OF83DRAFT_155453 [Amylostereum chailletii]|nr:hypothetical protein OF83DRAFT_155453 [Amylostereum chailletii]